MKPVSQSFTRRQLVLAALLLAGLFWLGTEAEAIFAGLTQFWQSVFGTLGLGDWLARLQRGTDPEVARRSLPALASYTVLYLGVCLLLLRVLLPDAPRWHLALRLYAATLALIAALVLLGKLGGNVALLYKAARRLIDFVVSPLPVMLLVIVLRTSLLGPAAKTR